MIAGGSWAVAGLVSAVLVWIDARRLGIRYGGPTGQDASLGAPGWTALAVLMPPLAVPAYLWRRRRYLTARAS